MDGKRQQLFRYYLNGKKDNSHCLRVDECLEDKVPAYIAMNNLQVHAIQFHPEKSVRHGFAFMKRILENA